VAGGLLLLGLAIHAPVSAAPAPPVPTAPSLGGLLVAPTRIVFEGRLRNEELVLVNTGKQVSTYRIFFVQMRMNETGGMQELAEPPPGERLAASLVRYAPRQVTLQPNVAQTVRVQLRKPAELSDGEYRSHLVFRLVPPESPATSTGADAEGMSVALTPVYGVAIPVFVRHGATAATATLTDLKMVPSSQGPATLRLSMNRAGNASVYGNLRVLYVPPSGKEVQVALIKGIAVYSPNPLRRVELRLEPPAGMALRGGRLRVTYAAAEGRAVLASAEITVP
jgi:P pilus assembly chaperone PapD